MGRKRHNGSPDPIHGTKRMDRNKECTCGSKKKYKRCCMPRQLTVPPSKDDMIAYDRTAPIVLLPEKLAQFQKDHDLGAMIQSVMDEMPKQEEVKETA